MYALVVADVCESLLSLRSQNQRFVYDCLAINRPHCVIHSSVCVSFFALNSLLLSMFSRFVMPMPYEHTCIGPHAQWQCLPLWIFYRNSRSLLSIDIPHHNTVNGIIFLHTECLLLLFSIGCCLCSHICTCTFWTHWFNIDRRIEKHSMRAYFLFSPLLSFDVLLIHAFIHRLFFFFLQFYFWFLSLLLLSDRSLCCLFRFSMSTIFFCFEFNREKNTLYDYLHSSMMSLPFVVVINGIVDCFYIVVAPSRILFHKRTRKRGREKWIKTIK